MHVQCLGRDCHTLESTYAFIGVCRPREPVVAAYMIVTVLSAIGLGKDFSHEIRVVPPAMQHFAPDDSAGNTNVATTARSERKASSFATR